jgi:hypothetical protein
MKEKIKVSSQKEIISFWFDPETREKMDEQRQEMSNACIRAFACFLTPSGSTSLKYYTRADKVAFAKQVQKEMREWVEYEF